VQENLEVTKEVHKTIKLVTEKIEDLRFNTAISDMMKLANFMDKQEKINKKDYEDFVKILSPFAPHMTDEILGEFNLEKK
jgi:leucyl-tRNA synthetase